MKIGIDIGGSHIGIGLVDENANIIIKEETYINDKTNIKEKIENFIIEKVTSIVESYKIESIGIAVPGTVSGNRIVKCVNLGLKDYDLGSKIEEKLKIPVKLKNDAKCATLAEQKYGELKEYKNSVFLCIGTGIGVGIIYEGELLEAEGVPGYEISHTIIQKDGELCNCGKRGCFEVYASLKRFKQKMADTFNLKTVNEEEIKKFYEENTENVLLKNMIKEYIDYLSIGISNIINIFEPKAICIGGSFSEYKEMLCEPLKMSLLQGNLLFNPRSDIIITQAKFRNDAGIIGATLI